MVIVLHAQVIQQVELEKLNVYVTKIII